MEDIDPKKFLIVKGAQMHNLKNVDLVIPRNKLVVFTGISGSGKSSLAFDTIYAEGQRRYVESLSAYTRQFVERLNKPKVEYIKGLSPAIAVEQKVQKGNKRSTVGTQTEIYDYLRLLYARIGKTISPVSGEIVKCDTVRDVVEYFEKLPSGEKFAIIAPISSERGGDIETRIELLEAKGYRRAIYEGEAYSLKDLRAKLMWSYQAKFELIVDRVIIEDNAEFYHRISDTVATTFSLGFGYCRILNLQDNTSKEFSTRFTADGIEFLKPTPQLFSFNTYLGACYNCNGTGEAMGYHPDLVIPNKNLSLNKTAIRPFNTAFGKKYLKALIEHGPSCGVRIDVPYFELSKEEKEKVWYSEKPFIGILPFFKKEVETLVEYKKMAYMYQYQKHTTCQDCKGSRLDGPAKFVKIGGKNLPELVFMPISSLVTFFDELELTDYEKKLTKRVLIELRSRLGYLINMGLGYLTLGRKSSSLSGGESQRIQLATALGSSLVGSMYVLDEPSIGLHNRDNERLIQVLKNLRDLGNTVIVVEHDESIIRNADHIVDVGPKAGSHGGSIVASGTLNSLVKYDSYTSKYLQGGLKIDIPSQNRVSDKYIEVENAYCHNLKNITVRFPLNCLTVVCGVSGSGKSSLVKGILYLGLSQKYNLHGKEPLEHKKIRGNFDSIRNVEYLDQDSIGRSSRSNPVTYIDAWTSIRNLYSELPAAKLFDIPSSHFSFNTDGGRCETCEGDGKIKIEMQFMADLTIECESCNGRRFQKEILEIKFKDLSIDQILEFTVDDAITFFTHHQKEKIAKKLQPLQDVGLGYVTLGQSSATLSGGEAQRLKLASYIGMVQGKEKMLLIFDEPTTGLHFYDLNKLLKAFNILIDQGHSIIVIEHNIDLIKCADHIIELGPDGGDKGGYLIASGNLSEIVSSNDSVIGPYLKEKLTSDQKNGSI